MNITYKHISELKPYANNPRKNDKAVNAVARSIKEYGFKVPIIIDSNNEIIAGHTRLKASEKLNITNVPCIVANDLTPAQIKAFRIADNKVSEFAEWDMDLLKIELDGLDEFTGFEVDEFNMMFEEEKEITEDEVPEVQEEVITKVGDLYEIGEHRLLCGDSTDFEQVSRLMNGKKVDMVLTDPPYNVNYGNNNNPRWKDGDRSIKNDNMDGMIFKDFIQAVVLNIKLFCDGVVYCFGAQGSDGRIMFTVLDENLHNSGTIIWLKDRLVLGRSKYHNKYEPIWFGWNKSGHTFTEDRTLANVFECKRPSKSELHPTMKPIELLEMPLNHNPKAKSILDLFLGSGSTMVACHQLNRKCYGMELDPKYCDVIIRRMINLDPDIIIKRNGIDCKQEFTK
jgi:DNA modification methylase